MRTGDSDAATRARGRSRRRPGRPRGGQPVIDRERLLDHAEEVIRRDGASASIEAIAAEAGVTKPIVYARVGGRSELADALAARLTERMGAASGEAVSSAREGRPAMRAMIRASLETVEAHRELFLYVTAGSSPGDRLALAEMIAEPMAADLTRWGRERGVDAATAEAWSWAIVGMVNLVSLWWVSAKDRSAEALADQLADLLWTGMDRTDT